MAGQQTTRAEPPDDWADRLRDYRQVRNLLNGDTIMGSETATPVTHQLLMFFADHPEVSQLWHTWHADKPRL